MAKKLTSSPVSYPKYLNFLPLTISIVALLSFWWTTKDIPYWWDSAGYVIAGTRHLLAQNFWPLEMGSPIDAGIAHPLLLLVILGTFWKIFGESLLVSHLVNLLFGVVVVTFTYLLTTKLYSLSFPQADLIKGKVLGLGAVLLLLFTPVFYAQLGILYFELPMAAFAVATVYFYLSRNWPLYILSAVLMLWSKEAAIFVVGLIFLVELYRSWREKNWQLSNLLWVLSPLLALGIWFFYHYLVTGWWYIQPSRPRGLPLSFLPTQTSLVFQFIFLNQWRFLISIGTLVLLWKLLSSKKSQFKLSLGLILCLVIPFGTVITFGVSEYLNRYVLVSLPFLYITFVILLGEFLKQFNLRQLTLILVPMLGLLLFLFQTSWNDHRQINNFYFPPLEDNLEYLDVISINKQLAKYLVEEHPNAIVYTSFPTDDYLSKPELHYVDKSIQTKSCKDYQPGTKIDYMVFHFFTPNSIYCAKLTQILKWEKALKFEKDGKFLMLYQNGTPINEATRSATTRI